MRFSLISTRIATPSVFTLTFNVSDGPPTNVSCSSVGYSILPVRHFISREIINGTGFITQVTVTVESRQADDYKCAVSNDRVIDGTFNKVTAPPSNSSLRIFSEFYHCCNIVITIFNRKIVRVQGMGCIINILSLF